jgi:hypothetical protein
MAPPRGPATLGDVGHASAISAVVFTLFVAVGSIYIILSKIAGFGPIYVTFVPVAIMVGYALLIWLPRSLRLRDDQAGDNVYYMGFLFTLTSLGVSLYQFDASGAAEEIVQNFGIAIGSTITGIALRVIFNQMRLDPIEIERTMRLELAEAARRVRRELDSTVVEFGYVRRSAQQAAADSFKLVAEKFDDVSANLLASMASVAAKSAEPLEAASRRSADMVEQLSNTIVATLAGCIEQMAAETERLSASTSAIAAALDAVTTKLEAMRTPDEVIEVRLEPVVQSLTQAIDRFTAQSEGQAAAAWDVADAARIAAESSSASIIALREEIAANSATNGAILEKTTRVITATAQILEEFETEARSQVEVLRHLLERTDRTFRALTEVLLKLTIDMGLRSDPLRDAVPRMQTRESLVTAGDQTAHIVEDIDSRRPAPKWEAIK